MTWLCDASMWQNTDFEHFASGGGDFLANSEWKRHFWLLEFS